MSEQEKKKKITLSVTEDTDKKISDLSVLLQSFK